MEHDGSAYLAALILACLIAGLMGFCGGLLFVYFFALPG